MKFLPILNAVGCGFLVVILVAQWKMSQELDKELRAARLAERNTHNEKIEVENRVTQLLADIDNLKATIDIMRKEADEAKKRIADGEVLANQLHTGLTFSLGNFEALELAVTERNARIAELNSSLAATRRRLDEAVERLKQAAATPR